MMVDVTRRSDFEDLFAAHLEGDTLSLFLFSWLAYTTTPYVELYSCLGSAGTA